MTISLITDEQAQAYADNYNEWLAKQPKYIAVEMTNEEIVTALESANIYNITTRKINLANLFEQDFHGIIKKYQGKYYKKALNPYNQTKTVLDWEKI